jgi:PAS domain S-box-containing protein
MSEYGESGDGSECEERLRFEMLLTDLSARFINLPADQVDVTIVDAQRRICECLGLDLCVLWQWEVAEPGVFTLTHHYRRLEGPPITSQLQATESFPWALRQLQAGNAVVIFSTEDVPEGAERDQESWRYFGLKNILAIPLSTGGEAIFGAISFHDMAKLRIWSEALVRRLVLVAQIFANTIARKRIELALRESAERLSLAMDAAAAGVWSMNIRSQRVWISDRQRDLFGFAEDENVTFDSFLHAIHRDDREFVRTAVEKALRARTQLRVEYRIGRSDGSVRWIAARGFPYGQEKSEPDRLTGIAMDITERKQAEAALEESQAQAATVMDSTDDLIWSVDPERFGLLTWNEAFRDYFLKGRGIEIKVGMTPAELVPPDYVPFWHDIFARAVREGSAFAEYLVVAKTRTLLLSLHAMQREGKTFGVSVFGRDITDRKRAEIALKDNEARLVSAVDIAGLGFYEVANGEDVTFLDSRAGALIGLSGDQSLGASALQFWMAHLAPEDRPQILNFHQRLNEGGIDQITVDFRYSHPQRGLIWLQLLSHVIEHDAAGHALRTIGVFRDITAQKTAEQEARHVQNELAHAMRVSTMGELAASMAHELNQPLAAILSNAQAARRFLAAPDPDLREIREILDDIVNDDKRAGEVVHHVRAMMQKKEPVASAPLDLNELVRNMAQLVHGELVERNIELSFDLAPALPVVLADQVGMQQVLLNLVVNAMDAMRDQPAERRRIQIQTSFAKGLVCVAVRDCGPGIPEQLMSAIFRPFFTTKTQGLGLGLALSRTLVEAHGGRLWAENAPDRGAVFLVEFPSASEEGVDYEA